MFQASRVARRFSAPRDYRIAGRFLSYFCERKIRRIMSAIPAQLRRFFQRLDHARADSPSSEIAPAAPLAVPALGDSASAAAPTVALCGRCRRALRRNGRKGRAARARARFAQRDERGRSRGRTGHTVKRERRPERLRPARIGRDLCADGFSPSSGMNYSA